jgi:PAS domain-containing protein
MGARFKPEVPKAVSAAELVRNFAECREAAAKDSLYVTHHGRATHVLMGIDQYNVIKAAAEQPLAELGADDGAFLLHSFADWLDEAVILCDAQMKILYVNRVLLAMCRRSAQELLDRPLLEAVPQIAGSLLEFHARRTVVASEQNSADIPSPFREDSWLHCQSFPLGRWNVLMFRDITEEVRRHRLADVKGAILDAMRVHGGVAYASLSTRGTIERMNEPFAALVALPEDRLMGVALTDIVATQDRVALREALEFALRGMGEGQLDVRIVTNTGELAQVHMAVVQLIGAYGSEGAVVVATPSAAKPESPAKR